MEWCDEQVQIVSPVSCILIITVSWQSLCTSSSVSGNLQQERRSSSLKVQAWSHIIPAEINHVPKKFGAAQTHTEVYRSLDGQYFGNWAPWYEIHKQQMLWAGSWRGRDVTRSAGHGVVQSMAQSQLRALGCREERRGFGHTAQGFRVWCFVLSMPSSANIFIKHTWDPGLLFWSGCLSNRRLPNF